MIKHGLKTGLIRSPRLFTLLFLTFFVPSALAVDEPPVNSSADIIGKKVYEEAERKVLEKKPFQEVPIEAPRDPQQPPAASFYLRNVHVRGTKIVSTEELKKLVKFEDLQPAIKPYLGRTITGVELKELQINLEGVYRAHGYFAIVGMPTQDLKDGTLILEVLTPRMGQVSVEGGRFFRKAKTLSYWKMAKGEILRYDKMQSGLQAMNENPDRQVKPILKAGKEPGTSDVILKVEDKFPVHAGFSLDNQGAKLTGKKRVGFTVRHNNLLSLDDIFLIGTVFGKDFGAMVLQHALPLTNFGTRLVTSFSHAEVYPKKEFRSLGIKGKSQVYSAQLRQKYLNTERFRGDAFAGFAFKEKQTRTSGQTTAWDRLRVLTIGTDFQSLDSTGIWSFTPQFHWGFSPHGDGFLLNSRQAESGFKKVDFQIRRSQRLFYGTQLNLNFETQLSHSKLPPQEEFSLGGAQSVRGYPESDYLGDQGILLNAEYIAPSFFIPEDWKLPYNKISLRQQIQLIGFVDQGYGRLTSPALTESRSRSLLSAGGGVRIQLMDAIYLRLEWARALGDHPLTEGGRSQFHFGLQTEV